MTIEMSRDYRLRWLDFDRFGHIQPTSVLDMMQDVAIIHAEEMGIGRAAMLERGVVWVVVRQKYQVVREPEQLQVVHVRTWPHTTTAFSFLRDFAICDDAGNLLVKASSEWVLMNIDTRKFTKTTGCYDGPQDFSEERAFEGKLRKVPTFDNDTLPPFTMSPTYSDIDVNGHVNNARYPSFVVDALNFQEDRRIVSMQIDYRYELPAGVPFTVHLHEDDGRVLAKGVREDGTVAFACALEVSGGAE